MKVFNIRIKATRMYSMLTREYTNALSWRVHIFHAYWTVLLKLSWNTLMRISGFDWQAALTRATVVRSIFTTYSAYPTLVTMVDQFFITQIIIQNAYWAEVVSKWNFAVITARRWRLYVFTNQAFDLFYTKSIELMILFRVRLLIKLYLIMAMPTSKELEAFWTPFLALASVMFATELWFHF